MYLIFVLIVFTIGFALAIKEGVYLLAEHLYKNHRISETELKKIDSWKFLCDLLTNNHN